MDDRTIWSFWMDRVNWTFQGKEVKSLKDMPKDVLGIIYRIDLLDGSERYYIGRKTVNSKRKKKLTKKEKLLPENKRKTYKYINTESNWKKYVGSSKELTAIIKEGAPYKKEILTYCFSKAEITYKETAEIVCGGALLDEKSLNGWVSAKIYKKHLL